MKPQDAIDILEKMIVLLEDRETSCLCGAYSLALNPNMTQEEKDSWVADDSKLKEIGLIKPEITYNDDFWFEKYDIRIRVKVCRKAITKWKKQL